MRGNLKFSQRTGVTDVEIVVSYYLNMCSWKRVDFLSLERLRFVIVWKYIRCLPSK